MPTWPIESRAILARARFRVRDLLIVVVLVGLAFGARDWWQAHRRADRYRHKAAWADRMARKCREIVAMDPAACAAQAEYLWDDPFYLEPAWTARMIPWFDAVRAKYEHAAEHPRLPLPPDPPQPGAISR